MKLCEAEDAIERLLSDFTDRETGEFAPEMEDELAKLEMARDRIGLSIGRYVLGLETEADAVDGQVKRLSRRRDSLRNQAVRLRNYLSTYLPDGLKLKDDILSIGWTRSKKVFVYPEYSENTDSWPKPFTRVKRELDVAKLKQALSDPADPHHDLAIKIARLDERKSIVLR